MTLTLGLVFFSFFKDFIYLFLERGKGRERERERNISVWLLPARPQPGTWPATRAIFRFARPTH